METASAVAEPTCCETPWTQEVFWVQARWEAGLADGRTAIQDDYPGRPRLSWYDLSEWVAQSGIVVTSLHLRFRDTRIEVAPPHSFAYFLRHGCAGPMDNVQPFVVTGHVRTTADEWVTDCVRWWLPGLTREQMPNRRRADVSSRGDGLVNNHGVIHV